MSAETIEPGRLLDGRYRLLRRLGHGGMASVWLSEDERLGREVAVKLLSDVLAEGEDFLRRFAREAQVAAGLAHPNLVRVYDFSAEGNRPYLVMELITGGTLSESIAGGRKIAASDLARGLLEALDYIHGAGVIHRDIKPSNVLLDQAGHARLTDFGIAKPRNGHDLTQTGFVVGTRGYMAPEVLRGEQASQHSDLYSLGVVLSEAGGRDEPRVARLIEALTAKAPLERPQTAAEALRMLTSPAIPTAPTVRMGRPTAPTQIQRSSGPRRGVLMALAAAAVLVAGIGFALLGGGDGDGADSSSPRSATEDAGTEGPTPPSDGQTTAPVADAEPEASPTGPTTTPAANALACDEVEAAMKALEKEKKVAEKAAGEDAEAKEEVIAQYEADKQELEVAAQECAG